MAPIESTSLRVLQLLFEQAVVGDVEGKADHADDRPLRAEGLEPNLGHPAAQFALADDRLPVECTQVIGDRLELGIVGSEVFEEVEADERFELGVQPQRFEPRAVRGRDP